MSDAAPSDLLGIERELPCLPWQQEVVEAFVVCPGCRQPRLARTAAGLRCSGCARDLPITDGILGNLGTVPPAGPEPDDDVGARVRRFYEQHPFPNYHGFESVGDLLARASRSVYAAMLDRQIPIGARVLEVGCGTGQLGAFLSLGGRAVVAVDMSLASLRLASAFAERHGLRDCSFLHADLFDLPLLPQAFDLVICKGVLHHTPDPRRGLRSILRHLRPGGYLVCGLYNRYGRLPTMLRRLWFRLRRGDSAVLDPVLRELARDDAKARSWYLDQYAHPHESRHSVDEVLDWFDENEVDFLQCVPRVRLADRLDPAESLFAELPRGTWASRLLTQFSWMFTIGREGGLFDMIGRKRAATERP